jgi:hypothetical protein
LRLRLLRRRPFLAGLEVRAVPAALWLLPVLAGLPVLWGLPVLRGPLVLPALWLLAGLAVLWGLPVLRGPLVLPALPAPLGQSRLPAPLVLPVRVLRVAPGHPGVPSPQGAGCSGSARCARRPRGTRRADRPLRPLWALPSSWAGWPARADDSEDHGDLVAAARAGSELQIVPRLPGARTLDTGAKLGRGLRLRRGGSRSRPRLANNADAGGNRASEHNDQDRSPEHV